MLELVSISTIEIHGDRGGLEELDVLLDAVLEDGEVGGLSPIDVPRLLI